MCRYITQVKGEKVNTLKTTQHALKMLQFDKTVLDHIEHKLLLSIMDTFQGGPVGLDTLSATIGEESQTIEDVYEPFLLQKGFIQRTPRGRIATEKTRSEERRVGNECRKRREQEDIRVKV